MTAATTAPRKAAKAKWWGPWAVFFKGFLKHPVMVGSIIPSSRFTIAKMLGPVDWENCKVFVEYGPGVGTFCRPVLDRLRDGGVGVVCQARVDFDGHAAVDAVRRLELRSQDVARCTHVVGGHRGDGGVDIGAALRRSLALGVVVMLLTVLLSLVGAGVALASAAWAWAGFAAFVAISGGMLLSSLARAQRRRVEAGRDRPRRPEPTRGLGRPLRPQETALSFKGRRGKA